MAMGRGFGSLLAAAALTGVLAFNSGAGAQTAATPAENTVPTPDNAVMLTIFLKHDQSRPLGELNAQLEKQGFYKAFPPAGIEVVSWYVMMGIGQVVTLRLPASRLREVNRIFETSAWGAYRTEFYSTYDYKAVGIASHEKAQTGAAKLWPFGVSSQSGVEIEPVPPYATAFFAAASRKYPALSFA